MNPDGRDCVDAAAITKLHSVLQERAQSIGAIQERFVQLSDSVVAAKLAAGLDPRETWSTIPQADILMRIERTEAVNGVMQPTVATVLRRSDSAEVEELESALRLEIAEAQREIREVIRDNCAKP